MSLRKYGTQQTKLILSWSKLTKLHFQQLTPSQYAYLVIRIRDLKAVSLSMVAVVLDLVVLAKMELQVQADTLATQGHLDGLALPGLLALQVFLAILATQAILVFPVFLDTAVFPASQVRTDNLVHLDGLGVLVTLVIQVLAYLALVVIPDTVVFLVILAGLAIPATAVAKVKVDLADTPVLTVPLVYQAILAQVVFPVGLVSLVTLALVVHPAFLATLVILEQVVSVAFLVLVVLLDSVEFLAGLERLEWTDLPVTRVIVGGLARLVYLGSADGLAIVAYPVLMDHQVIQGTVDIPGSVVFPALMDNPVFQATLVAQGPMV